MWSSMDTDSEKLTHPGISNELLQQCRHSAPGARLSARLRMALERMAPKVRRGVAEARKDGCAPLFIACKRGNLEIVEYLINICNVDIEQRGLYEVADDQSTHTVTALWCAAVSGRLEVLRALVMAGANIDAGSDSGSTPVRSACFMTHLDVVKYLVENGADIHKPNYNGGTCLINSVQSVPLCELLLEHGAEVNSTDMQNKSALHYAIQEHRMETTRLLLEHGADALSKSRSGDDALQTACLKGATQIFWLLCQRVPYTDERVADAMELLGSTLLDDFNDVTFAMSHWRRALTLRNATGTYIVKRPSVPPRAAFRYATEFTTSQDLDLIMIDIDKMRTQSLLICERVLGPYHKDTVFRLMYRGASYADAFRYQRCIDLWKWALEVRIEKDSLLFLDTCYSLQALVKLMVDAATGQLERCNEQPLPAFSDVLYIFRMVADKLPECQKILEVRPVFKKQSEMMDKTLKCTSHLIYLLLETAKTKEQIRQLRIPVRRLVRQTIRSAYTGDTLLHLSVSRLNIVKSTYFTFDGSIPPIFPHLGVVKLLLDSGADVNLKNESRSTTLHVASIPYNFSTKLIRLLLSYGAHIDQPNRFGDLPLNLIASNRLNTIPILQFLSLKCLASSAVVQHRIPYADGEIPVTLAGYVDLHRP